MSSDERLALRASRGDERAFAEIYERYHPGLYRFCLAMVGNPHDAYDTLQNTMVKVLRSLPGEEREIRLKPWLYRIARNESVETLRKRRDNAELEQHEPAIGGVTETAEARERLRTLLSDLEQLPERQRAALVMRELSGLDFDQIGAAFGTSAAVARQTLYEARLSLRQLEAGREMLCTEVTRALSDADGRVSRRRDIRAHLRDCADCRAFRDGIAKRHEDLAGLTPLPLAASAGLLHGLLGEAAGAGAGVAGGGGVAGGVGAGKAVATSAIAKSAATVAAVAVIGASAAGRSGLIDLPVVSNGGHAAVQSGTQPHSAPGEDKSAAPDRSASTTTHVGGRPVVDGASQAGGRDTKNDGESRGAKDQTASGDSPSGSQRGFSPPGGGYGRSASDRHDRPEQLPEAASHGQQTAQSHKPSHAASPPGHGGSGGNHGKPSPGGGAAPAKPAPQAKVPPAAHTTPPSRHPAEVPAEADSGTANPEPDATPPGRER
ncbi:MAG TPA: sigma-70 family RNA polymerase sigma factor [Solirubrobacterales bacterium]|nr:sigma-70 family RNA polymerase sigma factor [Solirubrobacterales bacterium]